MTPKGRGALLVRLICLGSALLWIVLVATDRGLLERFELAALDTELRLGPPSHASPDIIIVAVDERAVHRSGLPAAARAYGHLNLVPGGDGIIRAMPLVARYQDDFYSGFAVEVACVYLSDVGKDTEGEIRPEVLIGRQRVEGLRLGDHRITTDERGQLLLRFAGGRGSYATYSVAA